MRKIHYYYAYNSDAKDGGAARNNAFFREFSKNNSVDVINLYAKNKVRRLMLIVRCFVLPLALRRRSFFIHQGSFLLMFPIFLFKSKLFAYVACAWLRWLAAKNDCLFEVNDLPLEQARDLDLSIDEVAVRNFQDLIYSVPGVRYVFASEGLRDLAQSKYGLNAQMSSVVLNGANLSRENIVLSLPKGVNCVYVGGLNRGRQIEQMLHVFDELPGFNLHLYGSGGEWIDRALPNVYVNEPLEEERLAEIMSNFDIALLPYDQSRLYYNVCYPTKIPFYLAAGLPVLTTKLDELWRMYGPNGAFYFVEIGGWRSFLANLSVEDLIRKKCVAISMSEDVAWSRLIKGTWV